MKIKLGIGIPNVGSIKAQTAFCLTRMLKDFPYDYDVIFKEGSILHWNRESIVKKAIELKCTHLLFIDSDMYFEKDVVLRLLKHNKDVIGVAYNLRKLPSVTTIKMPRGEKLKGKLTKCDAVGTGFMLINLKILKRLEHPWFFWETDNHGEVVTGEDFWFCRLVRSRGYSVWADLTIPVKHIGDYAY